MSAPTGPRWRFFTLQEFACHTGEPVPDVLIQNVDLLVRGVLDPLRQEFGHPLVVVSGYRSPAYNARIGGARLSQHMTARAADIKPVEPRRLASLKVLVEEMYKAGQLPDLGGYGQYSGWVHLDVRRNDDGRLRRWLGSGIGSEET